MKFNSQNLTWILIFFGAALLAGWFFEGNWLIYLAVAVILSIYISFRKNKKS